MSLGKQLKQAKETRPAPGKPRITGSHKPSILRTQSKRKRIQSPEQKENSLGPTEFYIPGTQEKRKKRVAILETF